MHCQVAQMNNILKSMVSPNKGPPCNMPQPDKCPSIVFRGYLQMLGGVASILWQTCSHMIGPSVAQHCQLHLYLPFPSPPSKGTWLPSGIHYSAPSLDLQCQSQLCGHTPVFIHPFLETMACASHATIPGEKQATSRGQNHELELLAKKAASTVVSTSSS